jgi:hypothetical protein
MRVHGYRTLGYCQKNYIKILDLELGRHQNGKPDQDRQHSTTPTNSTKSLRYLQAATVGLEDFNRTKFDMKKMSNFARNLKKITPNTSNLPTKANETKKFEIHDKKN